MKKKYKTGSDQLSKRAYKKTKDSKSINMPIDELVEEHERLTKVIKSPSKKDDKKEYSEQMSELKKYKKLDKKEDAREIESEGREPIYSPKKKDGSRDILYYNPNAPTHKEGGVPVKVVPKNQYKALKSKSKDIVVPEGSAIVTAKNGKNKASLKAYKEGDKNKLNKIIDQMPSDKVSKSNDGGNNFLTTKNPYEKPNKFANKGIEDLANQPISDTVGKSTNSLASNSFNTGLNQLLTNAPAIYNVGKGLFGKTQKTERNYFTPENYQYKDISDPNRRAAQEEYQATKSELRRGAPNASTYIANAQMAANQRYKRMSDINNFEGGRKTDIQNQNAELNNNARLSNLNLKNQYNDLDLQNKAKKDEFLTTGLTQGSQLAQMSTLNKNRGKHDEAMLKLIGSKNFKYNQNTSEVETKTKGSKKLKYKMKK